MINLKLAYKPFSTYLFSLCILACFTLSSCCTINIKKPIKIIDNTTIVKPDPSYFKIRACISNDDFLQAVKDNIHNPIVNDEKPLKVVATILATEDITFKSLVNVLISPFKPGYWVNVAVKTFQTVRESFTCWLSPWNWGSCWRDVIKEVWITTQKWIEPQLAIWEWQTVLVTKIIDKIYSPEATVHYPTYLEDIKISFSGNNFKIIGFTTTQVKIDVESKIIPLTPEIKVKSLLSLDIQCEVIVEGMVSITNNKELTITTTVQHLNIKTPLDQLPKLGGKDFIEYLNSTIGFTKLTESLVENIGKNSLQGALERLLEKQNEKLNFSQKLDIVNQAMSGPKEISKDIWLNLQPSELICSNPKSDGNNLCINIGVKFEPTISYSSVMPYVDPSAIIFKVEEPQNPISNINLKLSGSLKTIGNTISNAVNDKLKASQEPLNTLRISNVEIYRTEHNKIVASLDVIRKRKLFNCKIFTAYLVGDLTYDDPIKQFSLRNVDFELDTKNKILNTIYKEFVDKNMEDLIEKNAILNIESKYRKANELLSSLNYETNYGKFSGTSSLEGILGPHITDSTIDIVARIKGNYAFILKYKTPEITSSDYLPGRTYENLDFRNKTINDAIVYDQKGTNVSQSIGKISDDTTYETSKKLKIINKNTSQNFSKYTRIDIDPVTKAIDSISIRQLPLYIENRISTTQVMSTEDYIYIIDGRGNKIKKRKCFEDQILKGEEYFIIDSQGEIHRRIY